MFSSALFLPEHTAQIFSKINFLCTFHPFPQSSSLCLCGWYSLHYYLGCSPVTQTNLRANTDLPSVTYPYLPASFSPIFRAHTTCASTATRQSWPFAASAFSPDVPRQPPLRLHSSEPFPCTWGLILFSLCVYSKGRRGRDAE